MEAGGLVSTFAYFVNLAADVQCNLAHSRRIKVVSEEMSSSMGKQVLGLQINWVDLLEICVESGRIKMAGSRLLNLSFILNLEIAFE